jgi:hypothetical protein
LTEFIEAHNGTLKHDYAKLTAAQKNAYVIEIMKRRVEKQKIVRDNPKAVQRDMLASFAAMDQEVCFHLRLLHSLAYMLVFSGRHCVHDLESKDFT